MTSLASDAYRVYCNVFNLADRIGELETTLRDPIADVEVNLMDQCIPLRIQESGGGSEGTATDVCDAWQLCQVLARGSHRAIVVAPAGSGKTVLTKQLVVCAVQSSLAASLLPVRVPLNDLAEISRKTATRVKVHIGSDHNATARFYIGSCEVDIHHLDCSAHVSLVAIDAATLGVTFKGCYNVFGLPGVHRQGYNSPELSEDEEEGTDSKKLTFLQAKLAQLMDDQEKLLEDQDKLLEDQDQDQDMDSDGQNLIRRIEGVRSALAEVQCRVDAENEEKDKLQEKRRRDRASRAECMRFECDVAALGNAIVLVAVNVDDKSIPEQVVHVLTRLGASPGRFNVASSQLPRRYALIGGESCPQSVEASGNDCDLEYVTVPDLLELWADEQFGKRDAITVKKPQDAGYSHMLLILDGLDEAVEQIDLISQWTQRWGKLDPERRWLLVTSRPEAFLNENDKDWLRGAGFSFVDLLTMTESDVQQLCRKRLPALGANAEEVEAITRRIMTPHFTALRERPLLATLLVYVMLATKDEEIIPTRYAVYTQVLKLMLRRKPTPQENIMLQPAQAARADVCEDGHFSFDLLVASAASLAFNMMSQGVRRIPQNSVPPELYSTSMLDLSRDGFASMFHLSMQEFLASVYMVSKVYSKVSATEEVYWIRSHLEQIVASDWWAGVRHFLRESSKGLPQKIDLWKLHVHAGSILACAVSHDGICAVTAGSDKLLKFWEVGRLWNVGSGQIIHTVQLASAVTCLACNSIDGRFLTSTADGRAAIWYANGQLAMDLTGNAGNILCCTISADGNFCIAGCDDGSICIWDAHSGRCLQVLEDGADPRPIVCCAGFEQSSQILTGSSDGTARVWNIQSGGRRSTLFGHTDKIHSCAVFPDGLHVLTASADWDLRVWQLDSNTGHCVQVLTGHLSDVRCCAIFLDGARAVSGSDDYSVRYWNAFTGECIRVLGGDVLAGVVCCLAAFPDNTRIVVGRHEGVAQIL